MLCKLLCMLLAGLLDYVSSTLFDVIFVVVVITTTAHLIVFWLLMLLLMATVGNSHCLVFLIYVVVYLDTLVYVVFDMPICIRSKRQSESRLQSKSCKSGSVKMSIAKQCIIKKDDADSRSAARLLYCTVVVRTRASSRSMIILPSFGGGRIMSRLTFTSW